MTGRVLITGARAPVALHWCRLFAEAGWQVRAADCLAHPIARFSRLIEGYDRYPAPVFEPRRFAEAIDALVETFEPDLILPTCEEVFHLAAVAQAKPWQPRLFAPALDPLLRLHDKGAFNALVAERAPAFAPRFKRLEGPADGRGLEGEGWVFKPCFSRFATHVILPPVPKRAALETINPSPASPWLAQEFLPGDEVCLSALVRDGQVVAQQAYHPLVRLPAGSGTGKGTGEGTGQGTGQGAGQGAGLTFATASAEVQAELEGFVRALLHGEPALSGQLSFDFRTDAAGQWKALECNPRSTSGFHFFGPQDGLVEALLSAEPITETVAASGGRKIMGQRLPTLLFGGLPALALLPRLKSLSAWPGDGVGLLPQARAFAELVQQRQRYGCESLAAAATVDICWNDPPHGESSTACEA